MAFFLYGKDGEQLITRPKDVYDGAMPSGNSVAAMNLLRLARLTGDQNIEIRAYEQLRAFAGTVVRYPAAYTHFMMAAMFALYPVKEIIIAGSRESDDTKEMLRILNSSFVPQTDQLVVFQGSGRG